MRHLTRKNLRLIYLTLLDICCIILLRSKGEHVPFVQIGPFQVPSSTKSGIISGIQSLICFLLVFTDYKKGIKISLGIILVSLTHLFFGMFRSHSIISLPGLVSNIVSLVTLITMYSFYSRLSVSNLSDYITGFGNRRSYVKHVNDFIEARKSFTIACIDLEEFKYVNDIYGIQSGDFLLKKTAEKLSSILNKNDQILF